MSMPGMIQRAHGTTTKSNIVSRSPYYLKSGELSHYGLACGYLQSRQFAPDFNVVLYREHEHYHVRTSHDTEGNRVWEVFDTLTPARAFYHKVIKEYQTQ